MKKTPGAAATPRSSLSPDEILRLAVSIADREGIGAASMRRLARELSVTPMALYWHFSDKDRLLDAMAEHVVADAEFTDAPDTAWQDRYREVLTTLVRLLRAHPWMGRLVIERVVPLPNYLTAVEIMLDSARAAGLDPRAGAELAQQAVQAVVVLAEYEPRHSSGSTATAAKRADRASFLATLDPDRFPNIRAAAEPLTTPQSPEDYYRLGIDMIIGGIRAVADPRATH
ncbi:MAG: TetR/AcrR family transcriptional regulator [Actinocatenispora sp.]